MDNVKAVAALHQIAGTAFGQREGDLFEFWDRMSLFNPIQRTAILCTAGIFGIFFGELGEIPPRLQLFQHVLRLFARFLDHFGVGFAVRTGIGFDQNVTNIHLFRNAEFVAVLIVVRLQIVLSDRSLRLQLVGIEDEIFELPLFWDGIDVSGFVALVVGLEFGIAGMNFLENIAFIQYRIFELNLGILFFEFLPNLHIGHRCAAGNQVAELVKNNLVAHFLFKLRDGQIMLLQELFVLRLADETSSGKESGRQLRVFLQFLAHFFVGHAQSETMSLDHHSFLADQGFGSLFDKIRQEHRCLRAAARELLL